MSEHQAATSRLLDEVQEFHLRYHLGDKRFEATLDNLRRRVVMQQGLHRHCWDRRCRRMQQCIAADSRPCRWQDLPGMSNKAKKRLVRHLKHLLPRSKGRD
jgi:hypothetical protein